MDNNAPPFDVIGIGADGMVGLSDFCQSRLRGADVVFGARRHLDMLPKLKAELIVWQTPLISTFKLIEARSGQSIVVLASGDPLTYGVATSLIDYFGAGRVTVHPGLSSATLARARMGWCESSTALVSLCGRPLAGLKPCLTHGRNCLVFVNDRASAAHVAELLIASGFAQSRVTVLGRLGASDEMHLTEKAAHLAEALASHPLGNENLVTLAIECIGDRPDTGLSLLPGLDDSLYAHDGQLSKRESRALALSALAPRYGEHLIDFGAGAGSVSIEWLRSTDGTTATAIEQNSERAQRIRDNAENLGVPRLETRCCDNEAAMMDVPLIERANAFFIGGGLTDDMMEKLLDVMTAGQRLVCHGVTIKTEACLMRAYQTYGGRLSRMALSRAEAIGRTHGWRPAMPLTQWAYIR